MSLSKPQRHRRTYKKVGFYALEGALKVGAAGLVSPRSRAGRALAADRAELVAHVGGDPSVTQSRTLEAVQALDLLIRAGSAALAEFGPVDRKRRALRQLARDVASLIDKRHRLLESLGWTPASKPMPSLASRIAEIEAAAAASAARSSAFHGAPAALDAASEAQRTADAPEVVEPPPDAGESGRALGSRQDDEPSAVDGEVTP